MALSESGLYACYQRLERPLFNVLYRMLWNRDECQDLLHDAFLRIWQRRKRVDESRVDSLVWISALNLVRNRLRWQRLWRTEAFDADWPDTEPTPEQSVDRVMQQRRLHKALKRLPAGMRDVLLLGEFAELSHADIAVVLCIPAGTVASRRHQALSKLRTLLTESEHD
ncbi:MAG TPA: sigma-70 family RNA polymerase sigma factor [Candidatus Saccharimonadales bacterium]|nr:sigma-70 family RNA polymerase sigma factor [Candidatus Saccharimonadales bacterium]